MDYDHDDVKKSGRGGARRGAGRPKGSTTGARSGPHDKRKTCSLSLPASLWNRVDKAAEAAGESRSRYIANILDRSLTERGL